MKFLQNTFLRLLRLAWSARKEMLLAALLGSATVASGIGLAATSGYLISAAALHPSVDALSIAIVSVRFFGIARGVFRYMERIVSHKATFRLLASLRVWFYHSLQPLIPARLLDYKNGKQGLRTGDLLRRVVTDIDTLQNFYIRVLAPPIVAAVIGFCMWLFLGAFGGIFALIFLAFFLLASVCVPLLAYVLSADLGKKTVNTRAELHAHLVDSIQGLADLVAFGQEQRQAEQIAQFSRRLNRMQMITTQITGLQSTLSNLLLNIMSWTILVTAIPIIRAGRLDGLFLALLLLAAFASFEAVLPLPTAFQQVGGSLQAARRLFAVVDTPPAVREAQTASPQPENTSLVVERLRFRYAEHEPEILSDITFTLLQGQSIAIVGPSGAGKSTLAHLLLRYWDYSEGHILLGGHELQKYQQEDLYKLISVVEQDTYLFNTTIRENLLLARPDASEAEMTEAAKQAQLHKFVQSLPQGYDTPVGEQGLRLSGGERQRVALARALLKNTPILILDEPTINLDAITERTIMQTLHTIRRNRTVLLITHRLIELETMDQILVLESGKIIERGTHTELLQREGLYWHMLQPKEGFAVSSTQEKHYYDTI